MVGCPKEISLFHQNIRDLAINKIDDISVYLNMSPVNVLCTSEHHLDMNEIETLRLRNYKLMLNFVEIRLKKVELVFLLMKLYNAR